MPSHRGGRTSSKNLLRSFETGEAHPLAGQPVILAGPHPGPIPSLSIAIAGDFLALVKAYNNGRLWPDELVVWNRKTGASLLSANVACGTRPSVVFLTRNVPPIPNATAATLEFWRIPSSSDDNVTTNPIHSFDLPSLIAGTRIQGIGCRGELRPSGPPSFLNSGRPFLTSSQQAIIIFQIYFFIAGSNLAYKHSPLTLVVHRRSLVDLINKYPPQISTEAIRQPTPWIDWGPSLTRWFVNDRISAPWITTSAGQRLVSMPYGLKPRPIIIRDFNPHNVAKIKDYLEHHPNPNMFYNEQEEELEEVANIFEDPVRSALPYCCTRSEGLYTYTSVLMDDERLLGLKMKHMGDTPLFDVIHFG